MSSQTPFRFRLYLLLLFNSWKLNAYAQRACYWPDGSPTASTNNNFIPCNAEGVSHCCNEGEACLSNGLCFGASIGLMYRGACTDKTWEQDTAACPLFCTGGYTSWEQNKAECPLSLFCTESPKWANMFMCPNVGLWCGNGTRCEQGDSSNSTVAEMHDWEKGTILHIANVSTTAEANATSSAPAATSSSCLAGVCLSTVKCLPISVPIGVGAGVGLPLAICVLVLAILLRREKRRRGVVLQRNQSKDSHLEVDAPTYGETRRDKNFKWNEDYSPATHMLGGDQIHELGTSVYELPPSGRTK